MNNVDKDFFKRADAHIHLSNDQITSEVDPGNVSASFMYGLARFNAWISARGFSNADEFKNNKQKMMLYFMEEYKQMLEENLDDYINNFNSHMQIPEDK